VLIVEDDFDTAELLCILVQEAGHECQVALNAQEARAITEGFKPEVALVDIGLPGEDGYRLVHTLKADPSLVGCRFVALTGYQVTGMPELSRDAGFEAHLTKPVSSELVLAILDECAADLATPIAQPGT